MLAWIPHYNKQTFYCCSHCVCQRVTHCQAEQLLKKIPDYFIIFYIFSNLQNLYFCFIFQTTDGPKITILFKYVFISNVEENTSSPQALATVFREQTTSLFLHSNTTHSAIQTDSQIKWEGNNLLSSGHAKEIFTQCLWLKRAEVIKHDGLSISSRCKTEWS